MYYFRVLGVDTVVESVLEDVCFLQDDLSREQDCDLAFTVLGSLTTSETLELQYVRILLEYLVYLPTYLTS
jgi:hypothetical protein